MTKIKVIDTETTGLFQPEVVQYGEYWYNDKTDGIKSFSQYIKPTKPIEFSAMGVHHITNEKVQEYGIDLEYCLRHKSSSNADYIVGHNVNFDLSLLPHWFYADSRILCTLALARKLINKSECGDHKLGTLFYYLGCNKHYTISSNLHDAGIDAAICFYVLMALLDKFDLTIDEAYDLLNQPEPQEDITVCPFKKHAGKKWVDVVKEDEDYLTWLLKADKIHSTEMKEFVQSLVD